MNEPNMEWRNPRAFGKNTDMLANFLQLSKEGESAVFAYGDGNLYTEKAYQNAISQAETRGYEKGKAEERERIFSGSADIRQPRKLIHDNK